MNLLFGLKVVSQDDRLLLLPSIVETGKQSYSITSENIGE